MNHTSSKGQNGDICCLRVHHREGAAFKEFPANSEAVMRMEGALV